MSNEYNEMFLEGKFEEGLSLGMSDEVAGEYATACFAEESMEPFKAYFNQDPNLDIDQEQGQCVCGEFNCTEEYVHWTSGW